MTLDFNKTDGLIPVIIQDFCSLKVLMLGYMNEAAFIKTKAEKRVTFYSRSRSALWTKGETSGNFLKVVEISNDCDQDTLLIKVDPDGPVCHTGSVSCFQDQSGKGFLYELEKVISDRIVDNGSKSYTNELFKKGINKIAQKVGEEAVEIVIEAKDDNDELFLNESADLLFHYLILLQAKGFTLENVEEILLKRHKTD